MELEERKELIFKNKDEQSILYGTYVDLFPCTIRHSEAIVKLRNQEKSRYNLNQKESSTSDEQTAWYKTYALRDDDIYWCICNKTENITGTIRLYDIKHDGSSCTQGSFIVDEKYAMGGPYALEAEIMTLDFCFDVLQMTRVFNDDRVENKNMNSISRRVGFRFVEEFERDGARFNLYELTEKDYKKEDLINILAKWKERERCI